MRLQFLFKCSWPGYSAIRTDFETRVTESVKSFYILEVEDKAAFLLVQEDRAVTERLAIYITDSFNIRAAALNG